MNEYHKIQTVFKRDPETKHKTLLMGDYSIPEFEYLKDNDWTFTEKIDGTNVRIMFDGAEITFAGKTDRAMMPPKLLAALKEEFGGSLDIFKDKFPDGCCLYGEGYGAGIQKDGGNYRQDNGFVLFDVKVGGWWLNRADVTDTASSLCIDIVPVVFSGTLDDMVEAVRDGIDSEWGSFTAEGLVGRPSTELKTRSGHRIITKLKHKDFPK